MPLLQVKLADVPVTMAEVAAGGGGPGGAHVGSPPAPRVLVRKRTDRMPRGGMMPGMEGPYGMPGANGQFRWAAGSSGLPSGSGMLAWQTPWGPTRPPTGADTHLLPLCACPAVLPSPPPALAPPCPAPPWPAGRYRRGSKSTIAPGPASLATARAGRAATPPARAARRRRRRGAAP